MYQNTIYISITWYSKIFWFPVKNADVSRPQRVSRVSYIFWILFGLGITVPSFIIVRYVWRILGRGAFCPPPHPWAAPKRPILNRAKMYLFCTFISSNCVSGNFFFGKESSLFYSKDLTLTSFSLVKQHVHFFFSNYWSFANFLDDFFNSSSFFGLLLIFIKLHICSLRFTKSIFDFVFQPGYFWRHYYSRIQPPWQYLQQTFPCDHWIGEVYLAS